MPLQIEVNTPGDGVGFIHRERTRQVRALPYTLEHDRKVNTRGELASAGAAYAIVAAAQARVADQPGGVPDVVTLAPVKQWPWRGAAWKPSNNALTNLVRAGALIAAEIDRRLALGERLPEDEPETEVRKEHDAPAETPPSNA